MRNVAYLGIVASSALIDEFDKRGLFASYGDEIQTGVTVERIARARRIHLQYDMWTWGAFTWNVSCCRGVPPSENGQKPGARPSRRCEMTMYEVATHDHCGRMVGGGMNNPCEGLLSVKHKWKRITPRPIGKARAVALADAQPGCLLEHGSQALDPRWIHKRPTTSLREVFIAFLMYHN